jgi:hypothetical protein
MGEMFVFLPPFFCQLFSFKTLELRLLSGSYFCAIPMPGISPLMRFGGTPNPAGETTAVPKQALSGAFENLECGGLPPLCSPHPPWLMESRM